MTQSSVRASRGPLLRDVAQRAGVSVGTVSNVLNSPEKVSPEKLARVHAAISELGFVPNAAARQLRHGRSGAIGLLVLDVRNPFFTDLAAAVEEAAIEHDLAVILATSSERLDRELMYLERFEQSRVEGILVTPVGSSVKALKAIRDRGMPVVLLDRLAHTSGFSSVAVDDIEGGVLAGKHLVDAGCRRIAFVGGPMVLEQVRNRAAGARTAVTARGMELTVMGIDHMTAEEGHRVGAEIAGMAPDERPDGVFAANDLVGLALIQSLLQAGIRIPEDVAVVGYDDIFFAALAGVPLTSVRQPCALMGRRALELLVARIQDRGASADHLVFVPELVVRASSQRPAS